MKDENEHYILFPLRQQPLISFIESEVSHWVWLDKWSHTRGLKETLFDPSSTSLSSLKSLKVWLTLVLLLLLILDHLVSWSTWLSLCLTLIFILSLSCLLKEEMMMESITPWFPWNVSHFNASWIPIIFIKCLPLLYRDFFSNLLRRFLNSNPDDGWTRNIKFDRRVITQTKQKRGLGVWINFLVFQWPIQLFSVGNPKTWAAIKKTTSKLMPVSWVCRSLSISWRYNKWDIHLNTCLSGKVGEEAERIVRFILILSMCKNPTETEMFWRWSLISWSFSAVIFSYFKAWM